MAEKKNKRLELKTFGDFEEEDKNFTQEQEYSNVYTNFSNKVNGKEAQMALFAQLENVKEVKGRNIPLRTQEDLEIMYNKIYSEYLNAKCNIHTAVESSRFCVEPHVTPLEVMYRYENDEFFREKMDLIDKYYKKAIKGIVIGEAIDFPKVRKMLYENETKLQIAEINRSAFSQQNQLIEGNRLTVNVAGENLIKDANSRIILTQTEINRIKSQS